MSNWITRAIGSPRPGWRLLGNVLMLAMVGAVFWLIIGNVSIVQRVTKLESSDCKQARSGSMEAHESCIRTLDFNDRYRPVESGCIQIRRANYPCPLTKDQRRHLNALLNQGENQ